jgi:hypothetical protein
MDSIAHRVSELIIVVGIRFLVDTFSAFKLYVEGLTQDGSQLVGSVVEARTGLGCGSSRHHVNWL